MRWQHRFENSQRTQSTLPAFLLVCLAKTTILFQVYINRKNLIYFLSRKGLKFIMEIIKINVNDEKYPQRLLGTKNFPTEIYAIGNIELLNAKYTVGIVGARKCTDYGRRVSNEFAKKLSEKGICIISGMATGIDGIAHNAAIEENGKTVAVLGSGLNHIYPPENEWLFYKILEKGGCIISEYPPETKPDNKNFPVRNRIISGLSDAVLIVEATHRSGSTITAKYAKNERKVIYAIPNNIYCTTGIGTNRLIQDGAILVTKPIQIIDKVKKIEISKKDINLNLMHVNSKRRKTNSKDVQNLKTDKIKQISNKEKDNINHIIPDEYMSIYRVLSDEPIHINELAMRLGKTIKEINPIITMMELEGYAFQIQINYFIRADIEHVNL